MSPLRLTEKRLQILQSAANHPGGLVERPYLVGFERVAWNKNAAAMVSAGWLTAYVHGGFEITPSGRDQIPQPKKDDAHVG
ncbi:hypothetical protein [Bosea sp. RAC05]|uniref:hypothetical protein n=1 Tax=Bosea sp. RAC05 TaxID=1842539 RepID=UPI00083D53CF|nr:hypothetical protein [Bosea sp. RAC05]AOG03360.1 hypothetical protein BSY19_5143 [Bosea sp. RAC05]